MDMASKLFTLHSQTFVFCAGVSRVCRVGFWFGFVGSALLLAVGTCVVLLFEAMPGLCCFLIWPVSWLGCLPLCTAESRDILPVYIWPHGPRGLCSAE